MDLSIHGIVALVRDEDGKFLLLKDADSHGSTKGWWAPPHGGCEITDGSEENGVIREVKEETSLDVVPTKKVHTQAADTRLKTVSFWTVETTSKQLILDDESSQCGWFTIDEALRLPLYPGTKKFFEKVKRSEITLD
jgi:ADP-ribose pyrophosphatase YjhB (NUDIX family)